MTTRAKTTTASTAGSFAPELRSETDVQLAGTPQTDGPGPLSVPAFMRDQFMHGDCLHLAAALAEARAGWGVVVVGEAEYVEDAPEGWWETGNIQHAWAVRPDGKLVDIEGVHDRSTAERRAHDSGEEIHEYPDARECDEVWCVDAWELSGEDDPDEVAALVLEHYEHAPAGTLTVVDEIAGNRDDWMDGFYDDYEDGEDD